MNDLLGPSTGAYWPYLVVLFVGVLPTGCWRMLGLVVAKGLKDDSQFLIWVRLVAQTLLIAVVAKLLIAPPGALAAIPDWGRYGSVIAGFAVFLAFRRSLVAALVTAEAMLLAAGYLAAA